MVEKIIIKKFDGIELNGKTMYEALNSNGKRINIGNKEELLEKYKDKKIIDLDEEKMIYDAYIKLRSGAMKK